MGIIIFDTPKHAGDNPVCKECMAMDQVKWSVCTRACSHLISWAINEFNLQVVKDMAKPPFNQVGGD